MRPADRIVIELPLQELWDENGSVAARRQGDLSADDIRQLLRNRAVRFVVADVGAKLMWVPESETFAFWKDEVRARLAEPDARVNLEQFPGGYCYFASEWSGPGSMSIVVLQRCH
jgi:hypothetical protein